MTKASGGTTAYQALRGQCSRNIRNPCLSASRTLRVEYAKAGVTKVKLKSITTVSTADVTHRDGVDRIVSAASGFSARLRNPRIMTGDHTIPASSPKARYLPKKAHVIRHSSLAVIGVSLNNRRYQIRSVPGHPTAKSKGGSISNHHGSGT